MIKAKVGDRICIVDPKDTFGEYEKGDCGVVAALNMDVEGRLGVDVKFDKYEDGHTMYVYPEEFVVIEKDVSTSFPDHKEEHFANKEAGASSLSRKEERLPSKDVPVSSAEAIRDNILRIREKRNDLLMEITALDKEESELVEKLKHQGFVLYEQNEPETLVTEEKAVLYADDIEADMNDPKNWKIGDLIECDGIPDTTPGKGYRIVSLSMEDNEVIFIDDVGDKQYRDINSRFKFHSRPL